MSEGHCDDDLRPGVVQLEPGEHLLVPEPGRGKLSLSCHASCHSCHRRIRGSSGTRRGSGKPGHLPWRRPMSTMCTSKYQVHDLIPCLFYLYFYFFCVAGNFSDSRYRPWPRVKQFLIDLEPGSFVCDVGEHTCF